MKRSCLTVMLIAFVIPGVVVSADSTQETKVPIRNDRGELLASVFEGLPRPARPMRVDRGRTVPGSCSAKQGLMAKLSSLLSLPVVHAAASCVSGKCGGHYIVPMYRDCGMMCADPYGMYRHYTDVQHGFPCDGWKYTGNRNCGLCQECQETWCDSCQ